MYVAAGVVGLVALALGAAFWKCRRRRRWQKRSATTAPVVDNPTFDGILSTPGHAQPGGGTNAAYEQPVRSNPNYAPRDATATLVAIANGDDDDDDAAADDAVQATYASLSAGHVQYNSNDTMAAATSLAACPVATPSYNVVVKVDAEYTTIPGDEAAGPGAPLYAEADGMAGIDDDVADESSDNGGVRMDLADGQGWFHVEVDSRGAAEAILAREAASQPDAMLYLVRPRLTAAGSYAVSTVVKGKFSHQLLAQASPGRPFTINGTLLKKAGTTLAQVTPSVVRHLASKAGTTAVAVNAAGSDC